MDGQKIQDLFLKHVEKIVLAIFVGVSGFLVFQAFQIPSFDKDPEKLRSDATRVKADVDDDHNEEVIKERKPTFNILARTNEVLNPVNAEKYPLKEVWIRPSGENKSFKRRDPNLFAPLELRTTGVVSLIARRVMTPDYPLSKLDTADPVVVEEKKVKKPPKRNRRAMMMGEEGMGGSSDEMMGMENMLGGSGMNPTEGMGIEPTKPVRQLDPEFNRSLFSLPTSLTQLGTGAKQSAAPIVAKYIVGTAALPHKEIYNSFRESLADASNYLPDVRDTPKYWNFQIQRADVTEKPVEKLVEADWVSRGDRAEHTKYAALLWAGTSPELVPADYRDDLLTMWVPPVLLQDYSQFVLHPMIPMKSKQEIQQEILNAETPEAAPIFGEDGILGANVDITRADSNPNALGADGMSYDSYAQSNNPYGFAGVEEDPTQYKLIRFYDFNYGNLFKDATAPVEGRKYVYRVRVSVKDPNFPDDFTLQPKTSSLARDVYERVSELQAKADEAYKPVAESGAKVETSKFRDFQRWTPWSSPSEPVSLPSTSEVYAGPIIPADVKIIKFQNREIPFTKSDATAKMVVSELDPQYAARIPLEVQVTEGTVLSKKADHADVIDPLNLTIMKLPNAKVTNRSAIIGLGGGVPLSIVEEDTMKEPGQFLIFNNNGMLEISDEVDDLYDYRVYSFADEKGE